MHPVRTLFAILICLSAPLLAKPHLVKDLNQDSGFNAVSISVGDTATLDGVLYFYASEPAHGAELWRTDGTVSGTYRLTDICPGPCDSAGGRIVPFHGQLYFVANDGVSGAELWRTDGTPGSERRVRDFCPGPCHGSPYVIDELHGALLFIRAAGLKVQLWRTDDFQRGTILLPSADVLNIEGKLRDRLFFTAGEDSDHAKLWSTDGTPEGTVPFEAPPGSSVGPATGPYPGGDFDYFWTADALWRTDGTTAGTVRLKSILELAGDSQASPFFSTAWNGLIFFFLNTRTVIRSDGTPEGTHQIATPSLYGFVHPVTLPAGLVFSDGTFPEPESLWRTRGTSETTEKFFELPTDSYVSAIAGMGDRAIVKVHHVETNGTEIWVTDGTAAGTRRLEGVSAREGLELASAGEQVFFPVGDDYVHAALWRTDGTEPGTYPVLGLTDLPASSGPTAQTAFNGRLVFSAITSSENTPVNTPLFSSDGSPGGTRLLSSQAPGATGFTTLAGRLFFSGGFGLWKTNGTPGGTERVEGNVIAAAPVVYRGELLLAGANEARDGDPNFELWRSDGRTVALVKEINPFFTETTYNHNCIPEGSWPGPGVVAGDHLVFAADDGVNGRELWTTDGTRAGTRLLRDINPKRIPDGYYPCDDRQGFGLSSDPKDLVAFRHGALFTADDGKTGRELWWTDGTHNGTHRVVDLRRGAQSSMPHDLVVFRGAVYFIAADDGVGEKLWRTDGTAQGTVLVDDLKIGGTPSWARELTVSRNRLFLAVYNESTGAELWTSRGDAGSTHLVVDLRLGEPGSYPQALTDIDGVLVFAADDGTTGLEPWRSDGTAAGTRRLGDINPGRDASSPGPFTLAGDTVFTGAYDAVHGRELWAIPLQDVLQP